MKLEALQALVAVVERGSFAAAAADMKVTPSAVSLQMKQLEAWFGRPLFDRSGRTAGVTPLAREIAVAVAKALDDVERFRVRPQPAVAGVLRLGAIPSVQTSALPVAMRLARDAHRDLEIRLTLAVSGPLLAALAAGRIDAAVVVRPTGGGSTRLAWSDLAREPFVLVVPATADERPPAQLLRERPWIRYDASLTGGRTAAQYVQRTCPGLRPAFEVADTDAIVAMVAEGLGVSVIPRPRPAIRNGHAIREVPLGTRGPVRTIALAWRRADADDRRIGAMREALVAAYRRAETGGR
ncbi:MAG TPA: LysR family transcriptional regulator [Casimicrobiaceae bacterium]|nr:LysR family transcriptional regulator [Casimicrobiaceae bacterium]